MNNVDDKFNYFQKKVIDTFNESFPLIKKSRKRAKDKKWISCGLRNSIKHKNRLYRKKLQRPTRENISRYKEYKTILDSALDTAQQKYYHELFSDAKSSAINMWKTLGSIINPGKKKNMNKITRLKIGEEFIEDSQQISNEMNNHFCTIGSKLSHQLPPGKPYQRFMKNTVNHTIFLSPIEE